jgi:hypothetical protein
MGFRDNFHDSGNDKVPGSKVSYSKKLAVLSVVEIKTYPKVLSKTAFSGKSETIKTSCAITPLNASASISRACRFDPATAISSWPLSALGGGPKTGAAMNVAPRSDINAATSLVVSG